MLLVLQLSSLGYILSMCCSALPMQFGVGYSTFKAEQQVFTLYGT